MKRHELIHHLKEHGRQLLREGARHSLYFNPVNRKTSTLPRPAEIANKLARKICRNLDIPEPQ